MFEHRHHIVTPPILPEMVFVEGGDFMMGIPKVEEGDNERPRHKVTVSPFCMGKYQVTQREYLDLMGTNPSHFKGDKLPVECVSWYDAIAYCNKLSIAEGLTLASDEVSGMERVMRGGSLNGYESVCALAYRFKNSPG